MRSKFMRVDVNRLQSDGERVQELNEAIPKLVNDLESSMTELSNCWEGPAWGAFQTALSKDLENLKETYEYMGKLAGNMQQGSIDYKRNEYDVYAKVK